MKYIFLAAIALSVAEPAWAQSPLADAARREAERRKQARPGQVQVLTNEDLLKLPPRATPTPPKLPTGVGAAGSVSDPAAPAPGAAGAAAQAAGQGAAGQPATGAPGGARDENYWRTRISTARDTLQRLQEQAEAFESRINALSADYVNRDDPAQRQQIFEARQRALLEFDRVKAEIAAATKTIADIEEEARRLNVPPGWLR